MRASSERLCLISTSARALAASAARGGARPDVFDFFGDRETRTHARRCLSLRLSRHGIDGEALGRDLIALRSASGPGVVVYGSGFESQPELLQRVNDCGFSIAGNDAQVVRNVKDPETFFSQLDELKIPHPQVCFTQPGMSGWLVKNPRADGGTHVHPWLEGETPPPGCLFQREVDGQPMSVLFLADGRRAQIIGFNSLWNDKNNPRMPYRYGGAINHATLDHRERTTVIGYVAALVRTFGLKGINGMDFIASASGCQVLELNPRPCATLELYDPDTDVGLVSLHVRACAGSLPAGRVCLPRRLRAYRVIYAQRDMRIGTDRQWPLWCRDLPQPRRYIRAGEPVCTVHAAGTRLRAVTDRLAARCTALIGLLTRWTSMDSLLAEVLP